MSKPVSFRVKSQIETFFLEEAKAECCTFSELLNRILVERYKNRLRMPQDASKTSGQALGRTSKARG